MALYNYSLRNYASILSDFRASMREADARVDANFQSILRDAQHLLDINDQQLADALSVSRPTINRWINGRNLPYLAMRKPVITWIDKQVSEKIRRITTQEKRRELREAAPAIAAVRLAE